jgi:uncharacterized protein YggT (Ycf19 family)
MGYFVTDKVGLILAVLNTLTFLLLLHMFLQLVGVPDSRVRKALDRIFSPALAPARRLLGKKRFDPSSLLLAAVLQLIALAIRKNWL